MSVTKVKSALPQILAAAENLPAMPAVAAEILRLTEQGDEVGLDEFAPVLERDPVLAAKLLRLANSAAYNPGTPVESLEQATSILGLRTLQMMALSFSMVSVLPKSELAPAFDDRRFWQSSMLTAVAARGLARLTRRCSENEAFLCGLFGGLGRLILSLCTPERYDPLLSLSAGHWPTCEEEEKSLGFNHSDVGAALLNAWQLPESVFLGVGYLSRPRAMPDSVSQRTRDLVTVLVLAQMAAEVLTGEDRALRMIEMAREAKAHGIAFDKLSRFLVELEQDRHDTAELLDLPPPPGPGHFEVLGDVRLELEVLLAGGKAPAAQAKAQAAERRDATAGTDLPRAERRELVDALSGLSMLSHLEEVLEREVERIAAGERIHSLGLVRIGVDGLEELERKAGRPGVDRLLRELGLLLKRVSRSIDLPVRSSKGEFALLISHATCSSLEATAQRYSDSVRDLVVQHDGMSLKTTVSAGAACIARVAKGARGAHLWRRAGAQLETARRAGGDAVRVSPELRLEAA